MKIGEIILGIVILAILTMAIFFKDKIISTLPGVWNTYYTAILLIVGVFLLVYGAIRLGTLIRHGQYP